MPSTVCLPIIAVVVATERRGSLRVRVGVGGIGVAPLIVE